eukprot:2427728-Ditylum_brightwellii.AAC.1
MIVDKTPSIDRGNDLAQTPKGETDNQSAQYLDLDLLQSKSKAPSFNSDFLMDSNLSTTSNLIKIKKRIQK